MDFWDTGPANKRFWQKYNQFETCYVKKLIFESHLTVSGLWEFMNNDSKK